MRPETREYIIYARKLLDDAGKMLDGGLPDHAARTACPVCFHAAQAVIFAREQRAFKTHHDVQSQFYRLIRDDPRNDPDLAAVLARLYRFKAVADYGDVPGVAPTVEEAKAAVVTARRFVALYSVIADD